MEYDEEDYLLLSGIQHFSFCRRQWALIHIEQQWHDNLRTVEGEILHEKTHDETVKEKRGEIIITRSMPIFSRTLGLTGFCDVVEFHIDPNGVPINGRQGKFKPIPIEYKRGQPKENEADLLQLCAQAMCLEEMLFCQVPEAFMYYGETRHRSKVVLDEQLRDHVKAITNEMHELYDRWYTPKVKAARSCKSCSLTEICLPKLCKNPSAEEYIRRSILEVEH